MIVSTNISIKSDDLNSSLKFIEPLLFQYLEIKN